MQTFRLRHRDHSLLFSGQYRSFRECIEDALRKGLSLDGACFDHTDLSEVNFDGAAIAGASFRGANLTGANISEASLRQCSFIETSLFNTCFCHTDLTGSDFSNAEFGGTDMSAAILADCVFSGPSTFTLNLRACATLEGGSYAAEWRRCRMTRAPLVMSGLDEMIVLLDHDILFGHEVFSFQKSVCQKDHSYISIPDPEMDIDMHKLVLLLHRMRKNADVYEQVLSTKS